MADLLLVEDDSDVAAALAETLEEHGHRVEIARSGEEGLALLAHHAPAAILLDVEMPVLDGREMARRVIEADRGLEEIPIILVSGVAGLREIAVQIGTPYFLLKPFRLHEALGVIDQALTERNLPRNP